MKSEKITQKIGFYFDQTRCMGCSTCVVACKQWHGIPAGPASLMRINAIEEGKFPDVYLGFLLSKCFHCEIPSCVEACPAEAISKREEDGIVVVDQEKCLGRDACGQGCSNACPAGTKTREFVDCMKHGKFEDAWRIITETNPFPGVCGRVCDHQCESECARGKIDEPVAIHALERIAADYIDPVFYAPYNLEKRNQKVAVVGSGPAGLTCAYNLAKRGYKVTVFEALPVAGGMLRVGIPEYHLPKEILDREIAFIQSCGVEIKTNMSLGDTLTITDLERFDAVFIATGAHKANLPATSGKDQPSAGVFTAIDFLKKVAFNETVKLGKRLLVVGGGDVALDCVRSARRLGVSEIQLVCLESLDQIPASAERLAEAKEEGIEIHASCCLNEILEEGGSCTGVECSTLRSMEFKKDGSLYIDPIENSEHIIQADTIIIAAGQTVDLTILPKDLKVNRGSIAVDANGATSLPKYFAGGDAAIPQRKVSAAIGSGVRAAKSIDAYLQKLPENGLIPSVTRRKSEFTNLDIFEKKERMPISKLNIAARISSFAEVELGLSMEEAKKEAGRCLECRGMCSVVCPYDAPQFGAEDNPKMQLCNLCLEDWAEGKEPMCVRSCPARALDVGSIDELQAKYGEMKVAKGFTYYEKNKPNVFFKRKES